MYKFVNNKTPDIFNNFLSNIPDIHQHDIRNATQKHIYVTFHGTTRGQKTCSYCGSPIWNFIIKNVIPSCAIGSFKICLRQLLPAAGNDIMSLYSIISS